MTDEKFVSTLAGAYEIGARRLKAAQCLGYRHLVLKGDPRTYVLQRRELLDTPNVSLIVDGGTVIIGYHSSMDVSKDTIRVRRITDVTLTTT